MILPTCCVSFELPRAVLPLKPCSSLKLVADVRTTCNWATLVAWSRRQPNQGLVIVMYERRRDSLTIPGAKLTKGQLIKLEIRDWYQLLSARVVTVVALYLDVSSNP